MQTIAERAEIGLATAYRYYSTMSDVLAAYQQGTVRELREFSENCELEGRELFDAVLHRWLALLDEHGAAMVQLRSRRGFLERMHNDDEVIRLVTEAWRRPVLGFLADRQLSPDILEYALFLANILFDPREIDDLRTEAKLAPDEIARRLTAVYAGALAGWAESE